jgi:alkenylglycerophosphocholine/alkenylglycerophosphoethanolamine hydrolase
MLLILTGAFLVSGALAIFGVEAHEPAIHFVFKPITTLLLFGIVGWRATAFTRLVLLGILLSLVGDVALLGDSNRLFVIGLAAFLLAHVAYIVAFSLEAIWSPRTFVYSAVAAGASFLLVRMVWAGAEGVRAPVILYATAISTMVVAALSTLGGRLRLAPLAAVGAVLFYISDSSLALNRFHQPIPHVAYLSLGVYWLGQLGIALTARAGTEVPRPLEAGRRSLLDSLKTL